MLPFLPWRLVSINKLVTAQYLLLLWGGQTNRSGDLWLELIPIEWWQEKWTKAPQNSEKISGVDCEVTFDWLCYYAASCDVHGLWIFTHGSNLKCAGIIKMVLLVRWWCQNIFVLCDQPVHHGSMASRNACQYSVEGTESGTQSAGCRNTQSAAQKTRNQRLASAASCWECILMSRVICSPMSVCLQLYIESSVHSWDCLVSGCDLPSGRK